MKDRPRARRTHDPQATRAALLRAGARLFAEAGFEGTRVERVAAAARVNKAMISYHFGGKRGLYTAILSETFEAIWGTVQGLGASSRPADEALRELIGALGAAMSRDPNVPTLMLREILDGGRNLDLSLLPRVAAVFGVTRDLVLRGIQDGRFRRVDPGLTHLQLVGSLFFFFASAPFRARQVAAGRMPTELGAQPTDAQFVAHVQNLMIRGLVAEPGAADGGGPRRGRRRRTVASS